MSEEKKGTQSPTKSPQSPTKTPQSPTKSPKMSSPTEGSENSITLINPKMSSPTEGSENSITLINPKMSSPTEGSQNSITVIKTNAADDIKLEVNISKDGGSDNNKEDPKISIVLGKEDKSVENDKIEKEKSENEKDESKKGEKEADEDKSEKKGIKEDGEVKSVEKDRKEEVKSVAVENDRKEEVKSVENDRKEDDEGKSEKRDKKEDDEVKSVEKDRKEEVKSVENDRKEEVKSVENDRKEDDEGKSEKKDKKKFDEIKAEKKEVVQLKSLTEEEITDIVNKHAKMEEKDKKKYLDFFWSVDPEKYGMFTVHQLAYNLRTHGRLLPDREIAKIFADLDHNNDFLVSLDEYLDEMSKVRMTSLSNEDITIWFKKFDQNKDGYLDRNDVIKTMDQFESYLMPGELDMLMANDKSGKEEKLSLTEFSLALRKLWKLKYI